jgi:hypothetical protein
MLTLLVIGWTNMIHSDPVQGGGSKFLGDCTTLSPAVRRTHDHHGSPTIKALVLDQGFF